MNAFVKKEIRLLLPSFVFAGVLALVWPLGQLNSPLNAFVYLISFIFCPALAVMLALSTFGGEVSAGTFSNLLAQPVPRQKIWDTKILLLAAALGILALLWAAMFLVVGWQSRSTDYVSYHIVEWLDLVTIVATTGLVIFSGGLWTVLLLRQVAAAFWFTLLAPGAILTVLAALFNTGDHDENFFQGMAVTVLGLYSLAGFFFARWLFFRAQDLQWSGGNIVMPELRWLARWKTSARTRRQWRPRAALWRKEFMLHQSQFIMAAVLLVLHLGVLATRATGHFQRNSSMEYVLEIFWGLWLVLPLLVGCAAIAEERRLGTLGGQLCLPARQRTQFAVKFLVVLGLSVFFGAVMPLLLEGPRILIKSPDFRWVNEYASVVAVSEMTNWQQLAVVVGSLLPVLLLVGVAVMIGLVSFYASSLARNTLQALAPATLGVLVAIFFFIAGTSLRVFYIRDFWQGPLHFIIGGPLLLAALVWFAAKNFRQLGVDGKLWAWNGLKIFLTLAFSIFATTAVYHRFWEKLTPFESAHGAARLSLADKVQMNVWWDAASVRLPDGKIWTASLDQQRNLQTPLAMLSGTITARLKAGTFYSGSNWLNIRRYGSELVGVKADGTLWISEAPAKGKMRQGRWLFDERPMTNLIQFGTETNWQCASPNYLSTLLVKTDGSLWRLGKVKFDEELKKLHTWPGLRTFTPHRLGMDSDWALVSWDYYLFAMFKTNGSIWTWANNAPQFQPGELKRSEIEPDFSMVELYDGNHGKFRSLTRIWHGARSNVGIREDGTFRIWADECMDARRSTYEFAPADKQIGTSTNWLALAGGNRKVVTLKADGTLWLWDFDGPFYHRGSTSTWDIQKVVPTQLGTHSDWIAVSGHSTGLIALAADGSLWFWPVEDVENYFGQRDDSPNISPWLQVSRKPQRIGNIFDKAK